MGIYNKSCNRTFCLSGMHSGEMEEQPIHERLLQEASNVNVLRTTSIITGGATMKLMVQKTLHRFSKSRNLEKTLGFLMVLWWTLKTITLHHVAPKRHVASVLKYLLFHGKNMIFIDFRKLTQNHWKTNGLEQISQIYCVLLETNECLECLRVKRRTTHTRTFTTGS